MNKTKNTLTNLNLDLDLNLDMNLNQNLDFNISGDEDDDNEPLENPSKELTDEIKAFRQKNKEFQSTNDHETYLIVCFSCKEDKKNFLMNTKLTGGHTLIDGYEMAKNLNIQPQKPSFKLRGPLSV